jgi:nucleoside-diphosphate-sugar epimerase
MHLAQPAPGADAMLPAAVRDSDHLDELLSEPSGPACEAVARLEGDLLLLGAGGKMGPTLARMARRASDLAGARRRIVGVSRFSEPGTEAWLQRHGVETARCDLLDPEALARLPDAANIVFMTGRKFGSTGEEPLTWAMNCHVPALVCQRFRRSRFVAFSTGNVYGPSLVRLGGSREGDPLAPVGEYAMSCLGRERTFEHFSRTLGLPVVLLRLNYAQELRYGVLVDVARRVQAGQPVPLGMGHVNAVWQGDANAVALAAFGLAQSPPAVLNIAGPETLSVRRVAEEFGRLLGREAVFEGEESDEALLSNAQLAHQLFGYPRVSARQMTAWVADWLGRGGETLGKPTHFESRDGRF